MLFKPPYRASLFYETVLNKFFVLYVLLNFWGVQKFVITYKYSLLQFLLILDTKEIATIWNVSTYV